MITRAGRKRRNPTRVTTASTPLSVPQTTSSNSILKLVLPYLSHHDLALTSLLNRDCQALAFPHLYHTVYLAFGDHLQRITRRAALDDGLGPLSISRSIKGLVLDKKSWHKDGLEPITQETLDCLKVLIPRLTGLQMLSWRLPILSDDMEIMPMFQQYCPNLKTFHIFLKQDYFFYRTGELQM